MVSVMDNKESDQQSVEELYDVHPLDRDYSSAGQAPRKSDIEFHPKLRFIGAAVFAAGLITIFLAAIVLGGVRGSGRIETFASNVHRLGMILILVGGIMIVVAYRIPHFATKSFRLPDGTIKWDLLQSYRALVMWNVIGFLAIAIASRLYISLASPALYLFLLQAPLTIACAFMVTLSIWHRGIIRGYAIGVLTAIPASLIFLGVFGGRYWGGFGSYQTLLLGTVAIVLISGLACAGYVHLLESAQSAEKDRPE